MENHSHPAHTVHNNECLSGDGSRTVDQQSVDQQSQSHNHLVIMSAHIPVYRFSLFESEMKTGL